MRGLRVGSRGATRFGIDQLHVALTARVAGGPRDAVPLEQMLTERKLVIVGDAGAGKTTFLRRVAHEACRLGKQHWPVSGFPLLIRIA